MNSTTDLKIIHWGILGCGRIAHKFAQDLLTIPTAKLSAVASRSFEKSILFGKEYNSVSCYGSYEELCLDNNVDVIYIATPHSFHFEHTMLCLNHSKSVLCEKPFALNSNQVAQMIGLAKEKNVFLMEAMWTLFLPHFQYVLNMVQSKELGEITNLKADFGYQFDFDPTSRIYNKKLGGGSLLDIGIYPVFAALSLIGFPDAIEANAKMSSTDIDENCDILFQYKDGATAQLYSTIIEKTNTEAIIEFENGIIIIHQQFHAPSSITVKTVKKVEHLKFNVSTFGYNYEAEHVTELLLNNKKESPIMSFDKSIQLIHLLDLIRGEIGLEYN